MSRRRRILAAGAAALAAAGLLALVPARISIERASPPPATVARIELRAPPGRDPEARGPGRGAEADGEPPAAVAPEDAGEARSVETEAEADGLVRALAGLFGRASDRELIELVTERTQLEEEDLAGVRDLRAYLLRLVRIALGEVPPTPAAAPLSFSRFVHEDNAPRRAATVFHPQARRIFAVFPTADYRQSHVTVHWTREGGGEPLLLERYPVVPGAANSYVWLRQPAGWEPARYSVQIFSGDESLTPLAAGAFQISASDGGVP